MNIRHATPDDLPLLIDGAREFFSSSSVMGRFDPDVFIASWRSILAMPNAVILLAEEGGIHAALGGIAYPNVNNGDLEALEMFWFARKDRRGCGLKLLAAFEQWGRDKGCKVLRMVHLIDSMPDKLERFYTATGFRRVEVHYQKELR